MRIPTALRELTSAPLSGPSLGLCLAGLIVAQTAMGLPDHLSVVTTNLNTHALVTLELPTMRLRTSKHDFSRLVIMTRLFRAVIPWALLYVMQYGSLSHLEASWYFRGSSPS